MCCHQQIARLYPVSLKPRRNWQPVLLSLMSCWYQPCRWCSLQLQYYCLVLILQETFCWVDDFVIPHLFMVQSVREAEASCGLTQEGVNHSMFFCSLHVAHVFGDQSRTWEVLYMSHAFSAFHLRVLFQREISIQRKWIVQLVHPLWNTHTTHPSTSRGNLWEGRTDRRSEHLHTSIYFIFVSRRCDGHFHFQCVCIALNVSKIYGTRCEWFPVPSAELHGRSMQIIHIRENSSSC